MRRSSLLTSCAAAAALLAPSLLAGAQAADPVPAAKRLPPITYGFVSVPDVTAAKERFNSTRSAGLFTDPALAELREMVGEKLEEGGEALRERLGITLDELLKVPTGEVTFAVVQTAPREVAVVGLLDYGTSEETILKLIDQAETALEENGLTSAEESFEGTPLIVWTAPEQEVDEFAEDFDAEAEPAEPQQFAYFRKDTHLVVASDPAALEAILVRWDGTHDSTFADNEVFSYIADRTRTDDRAPVLLWYADVIGSVRSAVLGSGQGGLPVQLALSYLPVLGLDEFKAIGGSMDLGTEEFASVGKVVLYADRTDRALGVFKFPPARLAPPAWAGADASSYSAFNWDLASAYDAVRTTYDSMVGPGEFDRVVAQRSEALPVDIKKDIVDSFTGRIEIVGYPVTDLAAALEVDAADDSFDDDGDAEAEAQAPVQPVIFALGLNDARRVSELLDLALDASGGLLTSRDFRGTPLYEGSNPADGSAIAMAVSGDSLLLTTDVARLETALRGPADEPLADSSAFEEARSKMPAEVSMLSFSDQRGQAEIYYDLFRSGKLTGQVPDPSTAEAMNEIADALPPFDAIQKYLGVSASYFEPDAHGGLWVSFGLETEAE
ncbi:hypothetical protein [Alienimonas californiensis]|uniref:DUF3352 domain-containing protein n=1 Tax=Alienimonas californiensis TaxID=2527989 RepID=A0A517PFF2_9PLAN|nr:hypothetical protein [Alienimonas californiensis]QDT18084.1 hypothetical protein CA12_42230 [Alienimonas californiensis]